MKSHMAASITLVCALLLPAWTGFAQTEQQTRQQPGGEPPQRPRPSPTRRMSDRSARDARNWFGFSLGVLGFYDSNVFSSPISKEGEASVGFLPRVFVNVGNRKSLLHLDYRFAYRLNPDHRDLDTRNHEGGLEYIYQASRKTRFSIDDYVRSGANDIFSLTSSGFIPTYSGEPGPNQQTFFDLKRMWSNRLSGRASFQSSRKNRLEVSGEYLVYRYRSRPEQDTNSEQARISDDYQFSKSWTLLTEASNQWVDSASGIRNGRIFRFLGGLKYRLGRRWEIAGKGGGERVDFTTGADTAGSYEASLTRTSESNKVEFRFARRSSYQLGIGGLNQYDTAEGVFDQQLSSRLSAHFLARYYRTPGVRLYGNIQTVGGGTGFEYALHPSLVATIYGHYLFQKQSGLPIPGSDLHLDRYIAYVGIYYLFPAARRGERGTLPRGIAH